jgi:succinoglycan biosynthesis transport protein ExoP
MDQSPPIRPNLFPSAGFSFKADASSFAPSPTRLHFPTEEVAGGLPELWKILMRHRGLLVAAAVFGIMLGFGLSLLQTPLYKARTALVIQNQNLDFMNTRQINPVGEEQTTDNGITDITTQIQIIQSEQLRDRVIDRLRTDGKIGPLERQVENGTSFIHRLIHGSKISADDLDYATHQQVAKNLIVKQLGPTRAIEILYTSTDPKFAAVFVNTVADEYIESSLEEHVNKGKQTEEWLSGQLEEMRARLQQSENALQTYATGSGLLFATTSGDSLGSSDISGSKLSQLQAELSAAENDRVTAQSHYETAITAKPTNLPDVLNDSLLRDLQGKLTDLRRQRAELLTTYTDKNERVRKIEAQLAPLEYAYSEQRNAILNRIHEEFAVALRREKLLKISYQEQAQIVIDKTNKGIQYGILKHQVDSNQQLYDSMLEQVKRAGIASTVHASNIQVFDRAKPAKWPFSPNPVMNAGLGLVGGLLTGCFFILFSERGNKTLHGAGELPTRTGLRELCVIPNGWAELNGTMSRRLLTVGRAAGTPFRRPSAPLGLLDKNSIELVTWSRKSSYTAESFRALVTSILFADEPGSRPRTIVVSSANAMEGKTTLTCNLGIAMAELQKGVLLIDGDLRNPRLHTIFDLENNFGLSTLLSRPLIAAQSDLKIMPTFVPGLFVLPGGPPTAAAANLFHSTQLTEILSTLRKQFDTIIIDTPPCLLATDARVVGRLSDAVILVVRAGRTPWEEAQAVIQQFEHDRTRVLGTVLNDLKKPHRDYAYYRASS